MLCFTQVDNLNQIRVVMGAGNPRAAQYDHLSPEQLNSKKIDILGKQVWRVIPYGMRYWKRAVTGILANGFARFADLLPFVFIGFAVDYYACLLYTSDAADDP